MMYPKPYSFLKGDHRVWGLGSTGLAVYTVFLREKV